MKLVVLIGCGPVADQYVRSVDVMADMRVAGVFDHDREHLQAFCSRWDIPALPDMAAVIAAGRGGALPLNLTGNAGVTRELLQAGLHVWVEGPLAPTFAEARELHDLAAAQGVQLGGGLSSPLCEAAQALGRALRGGVAGRVLLAQGVMDDGFGAGDGTPLVERVMPWLSWLVTLFGPLRRITAASAALTDRQPDFADATLLFRGGQVAQLTCSVTGPPARRLRIIGTDGILTVPEAWDNGARVSLRPRIRLAGRMIAAPLRRRVVVSDAPHPHVPPRGARALNLALGPHEMMSAIRQDRIPRLGGDHALHLTEAVLAIAGAEDGIACDLTTSCEVMEPMPWAL